MRNRKTEGGADITEINNLHDKLVKAAHTALDNEVQSGEVKASTLQAVRAICNDAEVAPTREASAAMDHLMWSLPQIDPDRVAQAMSR